MSVSMNGKFLGKKLVEVTHGPSGTVITTDAPKDNQGEGSAFSPTDLVAAALGTCILTIMANVCERSAWDLSGAHFSLEKEMSPNPPRRIASIPITFHLPRALSEEARAKLERSAKSCPVHHSLHPDIQVQITYLYDLA